MKPEFDVQKAFLMRVSFGSRDPRSASTAEAYVHLEDDADCHKYKVAVSHDFAMRLAKLQRDDDFGGFDGEAQMMIILAPITKSGSPKGAPTVAQLLAVWEATGFVEDNEEHVCRACGYALAGNTDEKMGPCESDCLGAVLRAARKVET